MNRVNRRRPESL